MQAQVFDAVGVVAQTDAHFIGWLAPRWRIGCGINAAQRHAGMTGAIEHMQIEVDGKALTDLNATCAIALVVQQRRKNSNAKAPRKHRNDATTDTAFGWHANLKQPAAGIVVHAASRHDTEHTRDMLGRQGAFTSDGVHTPIAQRGSHESQVLAVDFKRALPEVVFQRGHRITFGDGKVFEHPRNRTVAVPSGTLGAVNGLVDRQFTPDKGGHGRRNARPLRLAVLSGDQAGGRDGTSIDHGV